MHALARALGVARTWRDVEGTEQTVSQEALATICAALGFPADSAPAIARSMAQLADERNEPPRMIVTRVGKATALPASLTRAELIAEDGRAQSLVLDGSQLPPINEPGYYTLALGGHELTLAVAPHSCPAIPALDQRRLWGPAIQIPALRGHTPTAFGNFGDLDRAVRMFAAHGADAVAINPVHALFPGDGIGFSPYSPSSRLYFNGAMGDPALLGLPALPDHEGAALIDWESALPGNLLDLRRTFKTLDKATRARIAAANAGQGEGLRRHAVFDALDVHFRGQGLRGWRKWPAKYHDPEGEAVGAFAKEQPDEVEFHLFTQWLAREGLATVQAYAKEAGMAIGLLADLAVGVHTGGSDAWSLGNTMLQGLTIGAPPDPLGPHGQNWALTTFSPRGLRRSGYAPWIQTLRSALTRAGGLRIDHAFGLARLWVVPEGGHSSDGAYLDYPFEDLLGLVTLEAHRANALIVAEDLGTAPHGFGEAIAANNIHGMRVLWFERAADDGFIGPQDYDPMSVAMTGTHDTATVAGWWRERDLDWAEQLGRLPAGTDRADAESGRAWDRGLLWATTGDGAPRPAPEDAAPVVDAALRHIGRARSRLAIAPLEDLLAITEQPNLPGTITEHPNWRRRLEAPLDDLLADPETAKRIEMLAVERRENAGEKQ